MRKEIDSVVTGPWLIEEKGRLEVDCFQSSSAMLTVAIRDPHPPHFPRLT